MLNTPNEWHNEDDIEEYVDEDFSDEYGDNYDDNFGTDYGEDTEFGTLDDSEYENNEYEEGEEGEEGEYENNNGDGTGDNDGKQKTIIIIIAIVILLILLGCVGLIIQKAKNTPKAEPVAEAVVDTETAETAETAEAPEGLGAEATSEDGEISIDIDEGAAGEGEEGALSVDGSAKDKPKAESQDEASGLEIEAEEGAPTFANKPNDTENVTISIGDVGRKNPFAPPGGKTATAETKTTTESGLDFEIIEPPELAPEDATVTKLLQTKVAGIMYDARRPSAIINIDGIDQLVRVGDILSGFEFIAITKNKVVIRSDNNVYRASVGQPLNAEKITNPIEISNLETKFKGAAKQ